MLSGKTGITTEQQARREKGGSGGSSPKPFLKLIKGAPSALINPPGLSHFFLLLLSRISWYLNHLEFLNILLISHNKHLCSCAFFDHCVKNLRTHKKQTMENQIMQGSTMLVLTICRTNHIPFNIHILCSLNKTPNSIKTCFTLQNNVMVILYLNRSAVIHAPFLSFSP